MVQNRCLLPLPPVLHSRAASRGKFVLPAVTPNPALPVLKGESEALTHALHTIAHAHAAALPARRACAYHLTSLTSICFGCILWLALP